MCRRLLCILVFLFYVILEKLEFRLKYLLVVITACPSVPVAAGVIVFIITVLVVGPLRTSASWRTTGGGGRLICPCSGCVVIESCCGGGGRGCGSSIISQKCHAAGSIGRWPNTVVVRGDVFNRASWPAGRVRLTWKISSFTKLKISFPSFENYLIVIHDGVDSCAKCSRRRVSLVTGASIEVMVHVQVVANFVSNNLRYGKIYILT